MVQTSEQLGGQRCRETFGRSCEDFAVGDVYEHRPGRTITQAGNTWFILPTMNTHPLHFDAEHAKATLFAGDTLYAESAVPEKREAKSRPEAGLVEQMKELGLFGATIGQEWGGLGLGRINVAARGVGLADMATRVEAARRLVERNPA